VERVYTFGDRNRILGGRDSGGRVLSIGYLALVREARHHGAGDAQWKDWYHYFQWEDRRDGQPAILDRIERLVREQRLHLAFGSRDEPWSVDRALERYELLLYETGLVREAHRDHGGGSGPWTSPDDSVERGENILADLRRVLATAISRLRGKIKYRPVVFELLPPSFSFLQLQRAIEALAGSCLHKSNFRRLAESKGLVEETGELVSGAGGAGICGRGAVARTRPRDSTGDQQAGRRGAVQRAKR